MCLIKATEKHHQKWAEKLALDMVKIEIDNMLVQKILFIWKMLEYKGYFWPDVSQNAIIFLQFTEN